MLISETVFDRGVPLGRIYLETNTGQAHFAPADPQDPMLEPIADRCWTCPIQLRKEIIERLEQEQ